MILFLLTRIFLFIRCGYLYAHVLKVTNELTLKMIKVQHWKLYATHYNDDGDSLGIGLELKKLQFQYSNYEGMGVLISRKFSIGLKDQVMMIHFLTFMTEQQWMSTKVR
jgi:hypothetical protein